MGNARKKSICTVNFILNFKYLLMLNLIKVVFLFWPTYNLFFDILQCWICNTQWLPSVVILAFQKKLHAITVSQRNSDPWLGSESDSGCDCHWKNGCAFPTGNENLIGVCHRNGLLWSFTSTWLMGSCIVMNTRRCKEVSRRNVLWTKHCLI